MEISGIFESKARYNFEVKTCTSSSADLFSLNPTVSVRWGRMSCFTALKSYGCTKAASQLIKIMLTAVFLAHQSPAGHQLIKQLLVDAKGCLQIAIFSAHQISAG